MKAGQLKEVFGKAMLVEPAKVSVTMRNLRENDLLTTGARGVNAPDMTYLDAARVLIAHIVDSNPGRRAPSIVRTFGAMPWMNPDFAWKGDAFTIAALLPGRSTQTFEDAVAALIQVFAECRDREGFKEAESHKEHGDVWHPPCRIEIFEEEKAGTVNMNGAHYTFAHPPPRITDWSRQDDERFRLGRQAIAFVNQEVIQVIAQGFREAA